MENFRDKKVIAVIGAGSCDDKIASQAYDVGKNIALNNAILVCGGLSGCMEHASKGAKEAGGLTIGIVPFYEKESANDYIDIVIPTGMGHARNVLVVATSDAAIAVDGSVGTLSEIAIARKLGKPVIALESWEFKDEWEVEAGLLRANTPEDAVKIVIREISK